MRAEGRAPAADRDQRQVQRAQVGHLVEQAGVARVPGAGGALDDEAQRDRRELGPRAAAAAVGGRHRADRDRADRGLLARRQLDAAAAAAARPRPLATQAAAPRGTISSGSPPARRAATPGGSGRRAGGRAGRRPGRRAARACGPAIRRRWASRSVSSGSVSSVTPESASHMVLCPHHVTLASLTASRYRSGAAKAAHVVVARRRPPVPGMRRPRCGCARPRDSGHPTCPCDVAPADCRRDWTPLRRRRQPRQGAGHGPAAPHHLRGPGRRRLARAGLARDHPGGPGRGQAEQGGRGRRRAGLRLRRRRHGDGRGHRAGRHRRRDGACCRPAPATCSPPTWAWPTTPATGVQVALDGRPPADRRRRRRRPVLRGDGRDGLRRARCSRAPPRRPRSGSAGWRTSAGRSSTCGTARCGSGSCWTAARRCPAARAP